MEGGRPTPPPREDESPSGCGWRPPLPRAPGAEEAPSPREGQRTTQHFTRFCSWFLEHFYPQRFSRSAICLRFPVSTPWIPIFMAQNPGLRGRGVGPCGSQASSSSLFSLLTLWLGPKESACSAGDTGSIPGLGRSPGVKTATHSSILARRISWAEEAGRLTVHGVAKSQTRLEQLSTAQHSLASTLPLVTIPSGRKTEEADRAGAWEHCINQGAGNMVLLPYSLHVLNPSTTHPVPLALHCVF